MRSPCCITPTGAIAFCSTSSKSFLVAAVSSDIVGVRNFDMAVSSIALRNLCSLNRLSRLEYAARADRKLPVGIDIAVLS